MANDDANHARIQHVSAVRTELAAPSPPWPEVALKVEDGVEPGQLWGALRAHSGLIIAVAIAVFLLVMGLTLAAHMEFTASGRLYLGELHAKNGAPESAQIELAGGREGDVGSEVEILKSQTLLTRAILDSGLNVSISPAGWSPPRYWAWLLSLRDPQLLEGATRELTAIDSQLPDNVRRKQTYTVKFTSESDYEVWRSGSRLAQGKLAEPLTFEGTRLTLIPGSQRLPKAGASYQVELRPFDEVYTEVMKALNVITPKAIGATEPIKVITLEFSHPSPIGAAAFLRRLMGGYLEERQSWKTEEATAAESFVTNQLRSMRESLDQTQKRLADFRINNPVVVLNDEAKAMIEQIAKYEEQRVAARLQVAALSDMKKAMKNPNGRMDAFLVADGNDTVLAGLAKSLSDSRTALAHLEERYNAAAPDVREQRGQVGAQVGMIRGYVTSRLTRAEENLESLNTIIAQFEEKLKTVPGAELGLQQIARESEVYSKLYSNLLERQQQAAISKASTVSKNRILDVPQPPSRESAPKLALRLSSIVFGLLLGAGFVLMRRAFSARLESVSDVRRSAGHLLISATIPKRDRALTRGRGASRALGRGRRIRSYDVLGGDPGSAYTEAYRILRANLYLSAGSEQGQVVLITSPTPGDGKTTCALSLGAVLAADGKLVLVIDADIRKPSHYELTGQSQGPGLGSVLTGACEWQQAVQRVHLSLGELYTIGAGAMASPELLSSDELAGFLAMAKSRFDYVIIDAASFPLTSDALVLCRSADQVFSVLRLQHTPRRLAADHIRGISACARRYGVVINDVPASTSYGSVPGYPTRIDHKRLQDGRARTDSAPLSLS